MPSSPVLTGVTIEGGGAFPLTIPAGQWSPWMVAAGTDADAQTVQAVLTLRDSTGRVSNPLTIGAFTFSDPLEVATLTFPTGTPAAVEVDAVNRLRFRVKNTNA